uniref:Uncharacterized protein n=1 Tax=Arundo donax TaxID=35708 RepID=A0A0A9AR58_ARUDO
MLLLASLLPWQKKEGEGGKETRREQKLALAGEGNEGREREGDDGRADDGGGGRCAHRLGLRAAGSFAAMPATGVCRYGRAFQGRGRGGHHGAAARGGAARREGRDVDELVALPTGHGSRGRAALGGRDDRGGGGGEPTQARSRETGQRGRYMVGGMIEHVATAHCRRRDDLRTTGRVEVAAEGLRGPTARRGLRVQERSRAELRRGQAHRAWR